MFADLAEKPCGAGWYAEIDAARARLKGADLGLTMIENFSEQLRAFALTLPRGRFLADGRLHLDLVSREVIDRLLALRAADQQKGENGKPQPGTVILELLRQSRCLHAREGLARDGSGQNRRREGGE